jgi:hypothetical protein
VIPLGRAREDNFAMKRFLVLLSLMFVMASCAGMKPQRPAGFETYETAVVEVVADAVEHLGQAQMLQTVLIETLEERQVFRALRKASAESADATVIIQVRITRLREESNVDRITLGEMAGSNVVAAEIILTDGATQQLVSSFALTGESPDFPPSFDWPWGSLEEAMERLARRLANILLEWKQAPGG